MENELRKIEHILNASINNVLNFIHSNNKYKNDITTLKKTYSIDLNTNFNIFTAFSDSYYKENLHSDIIKYILDPHTDKIGNKKYIEIFKNFIETHLGRKIELDLNCITVEREKDRIDILIKDDSNNCIIIENKINNAPDMEDQIGRYYSILAEKKCQVQAVIYLTLSPSKQLNKEYSIKDPLLRKEIEQILIQLPIVSTTGESNFLDDILSYCIKVPDSNIFSTEFLKDYFNLLKYLGGVFMATELNTEVMYKIFEDKDTLDSFKILGNLWENKHKIIPEVFKDYLQKELGFLVHPGDKNAVFKRIKDDINIGYYNDFSFGFIHTPDKTINSSDKELFIKILETEKLQKYFTVGNDVDYNDSWVYKLIDHAKMSCLSDLKTLIDEFEGIIKEKT